MDRASVTCTDNESTAKGDVLERTDRYIKIALDESTVAIELYKDTPTARVYIGYMFGMEFTTTGE